MDRYYKNLILCGEVDFYCLLCKEAFEFPDQIERHIRWEQHRKNLKGVSYNTKYKDHRIYKIGKYYYCEVCNYATITSIDRHIMDYQHLFRKSNPSEPKDVPCSEHNVTSKKKGKTMDQFQRHGIENNHCKICNLPVLSIDHIETVDHMVAIIQTHKGLSLRRDNKVKRAKIVKDNKQAQKNAILNKLLTPTDVENASIRNLLKKENKYFYINLNEGKARCVQCKVAIVNLTISLLMEHRRAHNKEHDESDSSDGSSEYSEIVDHGNERSVMKKYGKKHYIKLNEGGSKGYCNLCDIEISANLNMFKQHVRGARHQGMLYARHIKIGLHNDNTFCPPMIKPFHGFLEQIKLSDELKFVCLNNTVYIDTFSFYFLLPVNDTKVKCYICNEVNDYEKMSFHVASNPHMKNVVGACMAYVGDDPKLADEFVRKMQRDLYHCGYCNKVFPYWDTMRLHLKSRNHRFTKIQKQAAQSAPEEIFNKSKFVKSKNNNALLKKLKNLFP